MQTPRGYFSSLQENKQFEGLVGRQRSPAENALQSVLDRRLAGVDALGSDEILTRLLGLAQR